VKAKKNGSTGWEVGLEYVYEYNGRLVTSLWEMKDQFATVEVLAKLRVQSVDAATLLLKLTDVQVIRADSLAEEIVDPSSRLLH